MSDKQEKICETLKERIAQLEEEVRHFKEKYYRAKDECEDLQKEANNLRSEAVNVIDQWEKENSDVRRKLEKAEARYSKAAAVVDEKMSENTALEAKIKSLEKVMGENSLSVQECEKKVSDQETVNKRLLEIIQNLEQRDTDMSQRIVKFEELSSSMENELLLAYEHLRSRNEELSCCSCENRKLQMDNHAVTSQAEKLIDRVSELKGENERLSDENERLQETTRNLHRDLDLIRNELYSHQERAEKLRTEADLNRIEKEKLSLELKETKIELDTERDTSKKFEKKIREVQDEFSAERALLAELTTSKLDLKDQIVSISKVRDDLETQFSTIKACYSTLLIETNDYKVAAEAACFAAQQKYDKLLSDSNNARILSEQQYGAALDAVGNLTDTLQTSQSHSATLTEEKERLLLWVTEQHDWCAMVQIFLCQACNHSSEYYSQLQRTEAELIHTTKKCETIESKITSLDTEVKFSKQLLEEQRSSHCALEQKLNESRIFAKKLKEEKEASLKENTWLKEQVESMRHELGDLDELLNANLGEMREDNEALQQRILLIQAGAESQADNCRVTEEKLLFLQHSFSSLESEFMAQQNTLTIAEDKLRSTTEELKNVKHLFKQTTSQLDASFTGSCALKQENSILAAQIVALQQDLQSQVEKSRLVASDKKSEVDSLRNRVTQYVELSENLQNALDEEKLKREASDAALRTSRENGSKTRETLEDMRKRCEADASSIKDLLAEREELMRDRDTIVERFNRLHDTMRAMKKEVSGRLAEELKSVVNLSSAQEAELQTLRSENCVLKRSLNMFMSPSLPKDETVFSERLNLMEGPLRHPKKRSVGKTIE